MRPFRYLNLWISKRHTVTMHDVVTVNNDMFKYIEGILRALAKNKTQWKANLFFAVKLALQKVSKSYAEVTPTAGMLSFLHRSSILTRSCDHLGRGTKEWILILRTKHSIRPDTRSTFLSMWRMNAVPHIDVCRSINQKMYQAATLSPHQRVQDPVNHPLIHKISPAMMKNS
jgi:hypothetical protein